MWISFLCLTSVGGSPLHPAPLKEWVRVPNSPGGCRRLANSRQAVVVAADVARLAGGKIHIVTAYDPKSVHLDHLPPN